MENKSRIRKELLKKRNTLTEEQVKMYSKLITDKVFSSNQYIQADTILIYASYQKEVSTYNILEDALNKGKRVYCPKVLSPGIMEFYKITSLEDVICGYKNIPEPKHTDPLNLFSADYECTPFMIMPLVGFDANKNRLGYGGGFYDRYLQRFPQLKRMGLAFECQKSESQIPTEETDMKPNLIITENHIF